MEEVILLNEKGQAVGTASKDEVHGPDTPLHLAFSCHVADRDGAILMTRRALTKKTWPGTWTNSFCGHPAPGESLEDAVERRARYELGLELTDLRLVLPDFRYRATDVSGIVENEICPVFVATATTLPTLNPSEAMDAHWVAPQDVAHAADTAPWAFSPWLVDQLKAFARVDSVYPTRQASA